jgi:hypothetical protein
MSDRRVWGWIVAVGAAAVELAAVRQRTGRLGGRIVVRCDRGHLFTTWWIPGASLKSLRLGWWRVQFCPVGRHVALVRPVRASDLGQEEARAAAEHRDLPLP